MSKVDKLHPGVRVALARYRMDEGQVARAMAAGELASPQPYGNAWFFALRITATGGSWRGERKEYVWRDPKIYMNQGFLDRVTGLPVIIEHPDKQMLDTDEYRERNVGTIIYPYLKEVEQEVWGIARILDADAAKIMREKQLSTSPAVVFRPSDGNETIEVGDGKHLLVEGKPWLVDHLAICVEGVWDKGGPPAGVDIGETTEGSMADNEQKEKEVEREEEAKAEDDKKRDDAHRDDKARDDAVGEEPDKLLEGIKVLNDGIKRLADRMDAIERRHDAARRDDDPEQEARQAAELHKLAEEEEQEAAEAETEDDKKRGDKKRDDRARDDKKDAKRDDDDDDEEKEKEFPFEEAERKEGESDRAYARRADALARQHRDDAHRKRDDESTAAYCDRMDAAVRKDRARRDAAKLPHHLSALADSVGRIVDRLDRVERRTAPRAPEDEAMYADAQARADGVYAAFGDTAPRAMDGETLTGYRLRLLNKMKGHSEVWKGVDLGAIARADTAAFANAEKMIYADAAKAARTPTGIPTGLLREVKSRRGAHEITEFVGQPISWMGTFMAPARATTRLRRDPRA